MIQNPKTETVETMFCHLRDMILLSGQKVAAQKITIPGNPDVELWVFLTEKEVGDGLDHFLSNLLKRTERKNSPLIRV